MMNTMPRDAPVALEQTSRLLWECCRRDPDPTAVRRALAEGADRELAVAAAAQHGIQPLLWRGRTLRRLLLVTWPLTTHELHRYHLTYALTDLPVQRVRSLLTLFGRWHGLQMRVQTMGGHLCHPVWSQRQGTTKPSISGYTPSKARRPEPVFE